MQREGGGQSTSKTRAEALTLDSDDHRAFAVMTPADGHQEFMGLGRATRETEALNIQARVHAAGHAAGCRKEFVNQHRALSLADARKSLLTQVERASFVNGLIRESGLDVVDNVTDGIFRSFERAGLFLGEAFGDLVQLQCDIIKCGGGFFEVALLLAHVVRPLSSEDERNHDADDARVQDRCRRCVGCAHGIRACWSENHFTDHDWSQRPHEYVVNDSVAVTVCCSRRKPIPRHMRQGMVGVATTIVFMAGHAVLEKPAEDGGDQPRGGWQHDDRDDVMRRDTAI